MASGASLTIECGASACVVALPDGSGYRAALDAMTITPLDTAQGLAARKATSGLKDTLKTQVRTAAPSRVRIQLILTAADGALRARHDNAKNSISNMR